MQTCRALHVCCSACCSACCSIVAALFFWSWVEGGREVVVSLGLWCCGCCVAAILEHGVRVLHVRFQQHLSVPFLRMVIERETLFLCTCYEYKANPKGRGAERK